VKPAPRSGPPREVRLIGGDWKRSKLPVADKPGLRPTPDRVRETLFNWLGQRLEGWRVLDAFAGSGALGFEAASRGAAEVVMLERDAELARSLSASATRLKAGNVRVEQADALAWMRRAAPGRFDLVLLDPPFADALHEPAVAAASPLLEDTGWLYIESDQPWPPEHPTWRPWRQSRAGAVHFALLRRNNSYTAADSADED
jgi:16S rRNA (guanine(966)-N(2))-methyltransferase RsmD